MLIRCKNPDVIRRKILGCSQRNSPADFDYFNMCRLYIESLGVGNVEVDNPEWDNCKDFGFVLMPAFDRGPTYYTWQIMSYRIGARQCPSLT